MIPMRALALLVVALLTLSACGAPEKLPDDVNVIVEMRDYKIELNVPTVKAGTVKFGIRNSGSMEHSFELIRTDLAPDRIPVDTAQAKAKEDGLVKQVKSIASGKVAVVTANVDAGKYVIICNIAGHYQLGMRAALTVN